MEKRARSAKKPVRAKFRVFSVTNCFAISTRNQSMRTPTRPKGSPKEVRAFNGWFQLDVASLLLDSSAMNGKVHGEVSKTK